MILFPCENCGKVIRCDDDSANQQLPCPYCQTMLTVPAEGAAECCLIFQDARHPGGSPMSVQEVQNQLAAGTLHANDLIWSQQSWRPIGEVLDCANSVSASTSDQPEIALRFEELAPLPGFAPLDKRANRKRRKSSSTQAPTAPTDSAPTTSLAEKLKKTAYVLVALGILCFGVVRALRIYNYATKRFARVMVNNESPQNIAFQFPFSGFDPIVVQSGNYSVRENLVVGIPAKKAMKIWNLTEDDPYGMDLTQLGEPIDKISVPIRPCHDTLVNFGQIGLPIYRDFNELTNNQETVIPQQLRQAIAQELASNVAPTQAKKLFAHAQMQIKSHLVTTVNDLFLTDDEYDLRMLGNSFGDQSEPKNLNVVLRTTSYTHNYPNAGGFTISNEANLDSLTVQIPPIKCHPPVPDLEFEASGTANITLAKTGKLHLEVTWNQRNTQNTQAAYVGSWRCTAQETASGEWTWHWFFTNRDQKSIRIDSNGTVTTLDNQPAAPSLKVR